MSNTASLVSQMGIIFLSWRRQLQKNLIPHKITLKQLYVLRRLSEKETLSPSQVADALFCDRPTATVILKNMERQGWISRERSAKNGKQIEIAITAIGLEKLSETDSDRVADREAYDPLVCLDAEERAQLTKLLDKVKRHIEK